MGLLKTWQRGLLKKTLKRHFNKAIPSPKLMPDEAKHVALIFDTTVLDQRKIVELFADNLRKKGKKVTLLAFFNSKEKPSLPFNFFNKKDLTWRGLPKQIAVNKFLNEQFDLVYCLWTGENLPLEYVGATVKAGFKVGPYSNDLTRYDVMIDAKNADLGHLLQQIEFYLTKITKKQDELSAV